MTTATDKLIDDLVAGYERRIQEQIRLRARADVRAENAEEAAWNLKGELEVLRKNLAVMRLERDSALSDLEAMQSVSSPESAYSRQRVCQACLAEDVETHYSIACDLRLCGACKYSEKK